MELILINSGIVANLVFMFVTTVFLVAQLSRDNSVMDIAYGPALFFGISGAAFLTMAFEILPSIIISCLALWATRLGIRIFKSRKGKPEDSRYAKWREVWMKKSYTYFLVRSYLQINLLQGVIIILVALPAIISLSYPTHFSPFFTFVGLIVFTLGLIYETLADWQLDSFLTHKKAGTEPANFMTKGLFKYSRRPNYFGETLIWWGLAIMVLPLPFGFLGLISPLLITYIVTKVTGPMLENIFLEKYPEEYQSYIDKTNYLVPDFKRPKITSD